MQAYEAGTKLFAPVTQAVLNAFPSAPRIGELAVIPKSVANKIVLARCGFTVPNIMAGYDWPCPPGQKPFMAQYAMAEHGVNHQRSYNLSDLGTGKTRAFLYMADFLILHRLVRKVLIVCPNSTTHTVWFAEIFSNFHRLQAITLSGAKATRKRKLDKTWNVAIINHDGAKVITEELTNELEIDCICIDELTAFRNESSKMWKAMNKIMGRRAWAIGMTGAPTPNGPRDAYAQCRLLTPHTVPLTKGLWEDEVTFRVSSMHRETKPDADTIVYAAMRPHIRFKRSEVVDLPPCTSQDYDVPMSKVQQQIYNALKRQMVVEMQNTGTINAVNAGVMLNKLLQISAGAVYLEDGTEYVIEHQPRIDAFKVFMDQVPGKLIVFAGYKHLVRLLQKYSIEHGRHTEMVMGGVRTSERHRIFTEFQQNNGRNTVLVAHAKTMAHGLTLTAADTILHYSPILSTDVYGQANGRISRPSQTRNQLIAHFISSAAERRVYQIIRTNMSFQDGLLKLFESSTSINAL